MPAVRLPARGAALAWRKGIVCKRSIVRLHGAGNRGPGSPIFTALASLRREARLIPDGARIPERRLPRFGLPQRLDWFWQPVDMLDAPGVVAPPLGRARRAVAGQRRWPARHGCRAARHASTGVWRCRLAGCSRPAGVVLFPTGPQGDLSVGRRRQEVAPAAVKISADLLLLASRKVSTWSSGGGSRPQPCDTARQGGPRRPMSCPSPLSRIEYSGTTRRHEGGWKSPVMYACCARASRRSMGPISCRVWLSAYSLAGHEKDGQRGCDVGEKPCWTLTAETRLPTLKRARLSWPSSLEVWVL